MPRNMVLTVGVVLLSLVSCTVATKKTVIPPQINSTLEGDYQVSDTLAKHPPRSVAILPFVNLTGSDQAFDVVQRTFYNHFSSLTYVDLELYQVDARLKQADLADAEAAARTSPEKLGEILGVDAVIYGEVTHYDRIYVGLYSQVAVGARLQMKDTKTGELLWRGEHTERKHQGGVSTTPVGLILTAISAAVNVREIELFRTSDDLFRTMVKHIPSPTLGEALRPPKISILVQDAVGKPKKAGDVIKVAMEGEPCLQASFDIGDFKKAVPMREEVPGSYVGDYRVLPGDNVSGARIVGQLIDDAGNRSQWIDVLGPVTIDTQAPAPPEGLQAVGRDKRVELSWETNKEKDLAGYRLYRSETPLTGYTRLTDTELTRIEDQDVENGCSYYYQISALDLAGNESERTSQVVGNPLTPGPTPVQGEISKKTTWLAGASPYIVVGEVVVTDKATLSIESGTEVVSSGPGLTVRGRLQAAGEKERSILFHAGEKSHWQGIRLMGAGESTLRFCRISDARVGIAMQAASPEISSCELADNGVAIRVEESFAKPFISKSTLRNNRQAAVEVVSAAAPRIEENIIANNQGLGVSLQGAGGSLSGNKITNNQGGGVFARGASTVIFKNNIHDNRIFDLFNEEGGEALQAPGNWWGTTKVLSILGRVQGRVDLPTILNEPYPGGAEVTLPIWSGMLKGKIAEDTYLIRAHSPYVVGDQVVIEGGATLTIQPGVELRFNTRQTGLVVRDGGVDARGTAETPIVFTSNSASCSAGSFESAVVMEAETNIPSFFKYCVFRHATNALVILHGSPDIAYSLIADNSQSGIQCRNNATPHISYNTMRNNAGTGAVECYGRSAPQIHYNNIYRNPFAIQSFSTIYVDARDNWWGAAPPDPALFIGQVNRAGALEAPVPEAFELEPRK